jgi:SAM-dependent methyltransferase
MNINSLNSNTYQHDEAFDQQFSPSVQKLSKIHWSPLKIIKTAANFLAPHPGSKVIDIGSGAGKFCIAAAHYCPHADFYGIEQRKNLYHTSKRLKIRAGLNNVHFTHGDFTEINLKDYDGIYFFNSFAENLSSYGRIDNSIQYSPSLYNYYANYLYKILEEKPIGTRLVTYHVDENEIPASYRVTDSGFDQKLKLLIKH